MPLPVDANLTDSDQVLADAGAASGVGKPSFTADQITYQLTTSWGGSNSIDYWARPSISYALLDTAPTNGRSTGYTDPGAAGVQALTANEKSFASLAFQTWSELVPLTMTDITGRAGANAADITFNYSATTNGDGTYDTWRSNATAPVPSTYHGTSYGSGTGPSGANAFTWSQVWIDGNPTWSTNQSSAIGYESYGLTTYIHEIGHALGLSHPGLYNAGSGGTINYSSSAVFAQDNRENTVMSYFGGYDPSTNSWAQDGTFANWYYPSTPMVYDVAAIQALYGTNTTTRSGDTTYGFNTTITGADRNVYDFALNTHPIYTIWDGGGTNTLDGSLSSANQTFDLRPGNYSSLDGMNGNIGIAYGTYVNVAIGGSGNDTFFVNGQNDTIDGRAGTNTVVFTGARSNYSVVQDASGHIVVSDHRSGGDATVTTSNIQAYQFTDQTYTANQLLITPKTVEAFGVTRLDQVGSGFFLDDSTGSGPSLKLGGSVVTLGQLGGWAPIGAEKTATGYQVAFKMTGADQYAVWSTDANGNYITNALGAVSGSDPSLLGLEKSFAQDLNNDGQIGVPNIPNAINVDSTGTDKFVASTGVDNFVFHASFGKDVISGFDVKQDGLWFDHTMFSSPADILNHATDVNGNVTIVLDANNSVTLQGVTKAQLTASDFHLV
jgi:hypothetical protein